MKILIDAHLSENKLTGIGRYLNGLIQGLIEQDRENEYFILVQDKIETKHQLSQLEAPNLTEIKIDLKGPSLRQHILIPKLLKELKPDVYHHPHFDLPLFIRASSVITIHDLKYIRNPAFFPEMSAAKRWYMKHKMAHSVKCAQKVITVSNSTKHDLIDLFNIPEDKIEVIYHGLEKNLQTEIDSRKKTEVLKKYNILDKFILFVGERRPHKNIINLIKAFKSIRNNLHYKLKLVIIGKSYSRYREPEHEIAKHNLENDVIITDFVGDDELTVFYSTAEMLILPSYYEGFGLPLLEAMASGTPVIGSKVTSIPEVIGDAGLFIDPDDPEDIAQKIHQIISNSEIANKLSIAGLARSKKFSCESMAESTLNVYIKAKKITTDGKFKIKFCY